MLEEIRQDLKSRTSSMLDSSIEEIHPENQFLKGDATIAEVLISSDRYLFLPNDMKQDVTIEKLPHSYPAIKAKFERVGSERAVSRLQLPISHSMFVFQNVDFLVS